MADPLESAWLKLDRANHHANLLKDSIKRWTEDRPYEVTLDKEGDTGEQVCHIHIERHPPLEWSILIGEIIYGLRSALDHAVYALSIPESGEPPKGTEFPIFKDEPAFRNEKRPGGLWKLRGLSENTAAIEVIDAIQPFRQTGGEPERHILWVLQGLCNADKHRSLNLTSIALGASNFTLEAAGGVTVKRSQVRADGPVKDGDEIARWSVALSGEGKVELNGKLAVDVAFDETGHAKGEPVMRGLIMIGSTVKMLLSELDKTV